MKIVFFVNTITALNGEMKKLLKMIRYISDYFDHETYYINHFHKEDHEHSGNSRLIFCDITDCDYTQFNDAIFITPFNHLFSLLIEINKYQIQNARLVLFIYDPSITSWLFNQVVGEIGQNEKDELLKLVSNTNSYCFSNKRAVLSSFSGNTGINFKNAYVPLVPFNDIPPYRSTGLVGTKRFSVGWLGPISDNTIDSIVNLAENLIRMGLELKIDFHIIGDGKAKWKIDFKRFTPDIRFIYSPNLKEKERATYILDNVDLIISSNDFAIESALLGVPTVIPIINPGFFIDDKYVYLFDTTDDRLSWNRIDLWKSKCKTSSIREIIESIYIFNQKNNLGRQCYEYVTNTFSYNDSANTLLKVMNNTNLTIGNCLTIPIIIKQLTDYEHLYKKGIISDYLSFTDYNNNRKLLCSKNGWDKLKLRFKYYLQNHSYEVRKITSHLITWGKVKVRYHPIQKSYQNKLQLIREKVSNGHLIKAAFFVMYDNAFQFRPLFEIMKKDAAFDSSIVVIPDVYRGLKHQIECYNNTYNSLSQEYPDSIKNGYDIINNDYLKLDNDYDLIFFCSPYKQMAHPNHFINYFLDKKCLTIFTDYGFPLVKQWSDIITSDFYNYIWLACVESKMNLTYLKRHQPLKGKNSIVTGYLKMDSLASISPSIRTRKRILICPHHTVNGVHKTLNISNFMTYAEFFIDLPKRYPQIDFVFRPHPLLFSNLLRWGIWTASDINEYLKRIQANPNVEYDTSGNYFSQFVNSDAMIHDCGSFTGEYLYTEKPCCYMLKSEEEIEEMFLPLGKACLGNYYKAFSHEDIIDFIDNVVIKGDDPLKEKRIEFVRNELKMKYPYAAQAFLNYLKKTLNVPISDSNN